MGRKLEFNYLTLTNAIRGFMVKLAVIIYWKGFSAACAVMK